MAEIVYFFNKEGVELLAKLVVVNAYKVKAGVEQDIVLEGEFE